MKCTNQSCNEVVQPGAKFCIACGTPVVAASNGNETLSDFMYLLGEDRLRRIENVNFNPPFGAVGITMVDGTINQIHFPSASPKVGGNYFVDLLQSAMEMASALVGNKKRDVMTYVMMDYRNLPVASYQLKIPKAGQLESNLNFRFWVDVENRQDMLMFIQRCLKGAQSLPLVEFVKIASVALEQFLSGKDLVAMSQSQDGLTGVFEQLKQAYGITAACELRIGTSVKRQEYAFSQETSTHECKKCGAVSSQFTRFCESCGAPQNISDYAEGNRYLVSKDGTKLTIRVSTLFAQSNGANLIPESDFKQGVFALLSHEIAKHETSHLKTAAGLAAFSDTISTKIKATWPGEVVDFSVVDLGGSDEDWYFGIDALVESEIKKVEANQKALEIDERNLDLKEAAFAIALRRVRQNDTEQLALRSAGIDTKKQSIDLDLQEHAIDTDAALKHDDIDDKAQLMRLDRELEMEAHKSMAHKTRTGLDIGNMQVDDQLDAAQLEIERARQAREAVARREVLGNTHAEEVAQFSHEQAMEEAALAHDLNLDSRTHSAALDKQRQAHQAELEARRGNLHVSSEEEQEAIRLAGLKAAQDIQLAGTAQAQTQNIELDGLERKVDIEEGAKDRQHGRELSKLEKMAEMEARMAEQDHAQEQAMAQLNQQAEKTKYESLRGLSAAEILAMQAAELVKVAGAGQSAVDLVKSMAESQAAISGSGVKEQMYQEMLKVQQDANDKLATAHKASAEAAYSASALAMENMRDVARAASAGSDAGYKDAAKIAQSVNEKSMDAMAKVATAAANKKQADGKISEDEKELSCVNPECKHVFKGKRGKFCPKCGAEQTD